MKKLIFTMSALGLMYGASKPEKKSVALSTKVTGTAIAALVAIKDGLPPRLSMTM